MNLPSIEKKELILDINSIDAVDPEDLSILCAYATQKKEILETGTKFGRTAMNLAKFCPADGRVVSIDWRQAAARETLSRMPDFIQKKVTLIEHDTNTFDFDAIGKFDMIFIDGDHSPSGVISDTKNALRILKQGGLIFWHDYPALTVKVGLFTLGLSKTQIGNGLGMSLGATEERMTDRVINDHFLYVRNWLTEYLKSRGIES